MAAFPTIALHLQRRATTGVFMFSGAPHKCICHSPGEGVSSGPLLDGWIGFTWQAVSHSNLPKPLHVLFCRIQWVLAFQLHLVGTTSGPCFKQIVRAPLSTPQATTLNPESLLGGSLSWFDLIQLYILSTIIQLSFCTFLHTTLRFYLDEVEKVVIINVIDWER